MVHMLTDISLTYGAAMWQWVAGASGYLNLILVFGGKIPTSRFRTKMRLTAALLALKPYGFKVFRSASKPSKFANTSITAATPPVTHNNEKESSEQQQSTTDVSQSDNHGGPTINQSMYRENEMKIQMLSKPLYEQIFKAGNKKVHEIEAIERLAEMKLNQNRLFTSMAGLFISGTTKSLHRMA